MLHTSFSRTIAFLAALFFALTCPSLIKADIPERVVRGADGTWRVETTPGSGQIPATLPVVTRRSDGTFGPGVYVSTASTNPSFYFDVPMQVAALADGSFRVDTLREAAFTPSGGSFSELLPIFSVPVVFDHPEPFELKRQPFRPRAPQWTIDFAYMPANAEAAFPGRGAYFNSAVSRVKAKLEGQFINCIGHVVITLTFDQTIAGAVTTPTYVSRSVNVGEFDLHLQALFDEELDDLAVYDMLPSNAVAYWYSRNDAAASSASVLLFQKALTKQFGLQQAPGNDAVTRISTTTAWDFSMKKPVRPAHFFFEQALTHEVFHAMGFISFSDSTSNPNSLSVLDLFRFNGSTTYTIGGTSRELRQRLTDSPICAVGPSASIAVPMSRGERAGENGDAAQASHWRQAANNTVHPAIPGKRICEEGSAG